jgi:putative FmdB family regulatory protein
MPTYEYACQKCGQQFEFFQSMKDQPLTTCPKEKCRQKRWGKGRVKKLMSSGAGLLFKGTGFYITDYRSENYKQSAKKESAAGETKSSSSESKATPAKTESKPASSTSAKKDK